MTNLNIVNHNEPDLDQLAESWIMQKKCEEGARQKRLEIEQRMLPLLEQKVEGQATTTTRHNKKIVVKKRIKRSFDAKALSQIRNQIPTDMLPLKISEVLDVKRMKYLQNNEPETFKLFERCIVSQPEKPNISIETIL